MSTHIFTQRKEIVYNDCMKIEDTVTITEAATLMAVSRQSVHNAIKAGKIKIMVEVAGRKLLKRSDVEAYKAREYPRGKDGGD